MAVVEYQSSGGEDVYIKGKKIGEDDYRNLAAFFEEKETAPAFWNAVLHAVAGSEDTQVRKVILAIVLDDAATHAQHRKNAEVYFRAKLLIHGMKPETEQATSGWRVERLRLAFLHNLNSTQMLIVLALIGMLVCFGAYIYYDLSASLGPHDGMHNRKTIWYRLYQVFFHR